jgi:ubiquinone/menaquinone biosynthesis C-methylase UbiE
MMAASKAERDLNRNVAVHNRLARTYEKLHGEIFNDVEQARLRSTLERALDEVRSGSDRLKAFDLGCGSGNLTGHLLSLGLEVTAADVADGFLDLVRDRYGQARLRTYRLNGRDLSGIPDRSFDLVATYSVLHHIPDYLAACVELARVCRTGGVIVIDHEASPNVWQSDRELECFRRDVSRFDWSKYARPSNYVHRIRRIFDPKHSNEGDIHVWPDDHIEWDSITRVMRAQGCEAVFQQDYLLYRQSYRADVFDRFRNRCSDTRVMMFRRNAP